MPNPIIKHQRNSIVKDTLVTNILGVGVSTSVAVTAHSTVAIPFLVTTKPQSASFLIQTFSYSYDGVVHVDSYRSDI